MFKKGTVLVQKERPPKLSRKEYLRRKAALKKSETTEDDQPLASSGDDKISTIIELNCDIIGDKFWQEDYPYLMNPCVSSTTNNNKAEIIWKLIFHVQFLQHLVIPYACNLSQTLHDSYYPTNVASE